MWQDEGLSRKSIKNLFGIMRAIYNFQLRNGAEREAHSAAVARQMEEGRATKGVQHELPHFTVAAMAALVNAARSYS